MIYLREWVSKVLSTALPRLRTHPSPDVTTESVSIGPSNDRGQHKTESKSKRDVVAMLEADNRVCFEVFPVDEGHSRIGGLVEDPAHVGVVQAFLGVVAVRWEVW